jgi:hypothetical protein
MSILLPYYIEIKVKFAKCNLAPLARMEFVTCPKCGTGELKPLSRVAEDRDPSTNRVTGDWREFQCDNPKCGFSVGGRPIAPTVNDEIDTRESTNITNNSSNSSTNGQT